MVPSACLHPVVTLNPSTGQYHKVPCGHCDACLVNKGLSRVDRCNQAFLSFRHRYLITLTYNDQNLPIAKFDDNSSFLWHPNDFDYLGCVKSVSYYDDSFEQSSLFLKNCRLKYNGVPVLSHADVKNWKKRFRKYIHKHYGKFETYFFVCGEYGPTTYRPHYHILFGFNRETDFDVAESVYQSWSVNHQGKSTKDLQKLGFVDVQKCRDDGGMSYVAQYLNCTTHLPFVLGRTVFRPFSSASKSQSFGYVQPSIDYLRECYDKLPVVDVMQKPVSGQSLIDYATRQNRGRVFPFIDGFDKLSHTGRTELYGISKRFDYCSAQEFADGVSNFIKYADKLGGKFILSNDTLPPYSIFKVLKDLYYDGNLFTFKNSLKRLYYKSNRVCKNADLLGVTVDAYVKRIEDFDSKIQLTRLKRFYEYLDAVMHDAYNPLSLADSFALYYNTDERDMHYFRLEYYRKQFGSSARNKLDYIPSQGSYASVCHRILLDTTKTKKRNDYMLANGKQRKKWIPFVNKKLTHYFTI